MTETESTERRPTGPKPDLTSDELAALEARDMPAEVAELLKEFTLANVDEARTRTQRVRMDLEGRVRLKDWTPETFLLYAENSLAEARVTAAGYFRPVPIEIPLLAARYDEAVKTSGELLEVVVPSGDQPFPGERQLARDRFPAARAAVEESPDRKRTVVVRAFNLHLEGFVIREVLGAANSDSRYGEYALEQLEYMTEKKERLVEAAGLTAEDETVVDQRLTLFAMLVKAKHVVPEVSQELGELLLETLPHRGAYPESFLPKVRDILVERMRGVMTAGDELQAMKV